MRNRLSAAALTSLLAVSAPVAAQPLEALPSILHLQFSQHPAWRAYKDALAQTHADQAAAAEQVSRLNVMTTPARLDAMRAQLTAEEQSLDRQASATLSFYAVLSPEQKRLFDELTREPLPPSPMHSREPTQTSTSETGANALRQPPASAALPPPAS